MLLTNTFEGLKGAHHFAMRHHGVEQTAHLSLKFVVGIDTY